MLSDPQTITIDSTPHSLAKVSTEKTRSEYQTPDESLRLTVSHQSSKNRTRRMVRVDQRVVAADPLTSVNEFKTAGIYIVIDEPEYGFDDADLENLAAGLTALTDAEFLGKVLGGEH